MSVPTQNPTLDIVALVRQGAEIEACIPDDISSPDLLQGLLSFGAQLHHLDGYRAVLQYGIGRMMTLAARRPDFLETAGFDKFGDFESHLIQVTGMKHSTLWRWKPIYEARPDLTQQQLKSIPAKSLYLVAKHVRESAREELLALAPTMTYEKLKAKAEGQGYLGVPAEDGANLILSGSKDQIREIKKFLENEAIQAHVGTSHWCEIILAAFHETPSSGWPIE